MVKLYRTTDRINLKIGPLEVKIAPLSFNQKSEIQSEIMKPTPMAVMNAARMAVKYAVKDIKGIQTPDGKEYKLSFDGDVLSDESLDDLLNIDQDNKIGVICTQLIRGVPTKFMDAQTNMPMEDVEIIDEAPEEKKN
jgi:hypothetical protein